MVHQGYGPLLYDVAMEIATKNGDWFKSTEPWFYGANSEDSENIWKYYYFKRKELKRFQFSFEAVQFIMGNTGKYLKKLYKEQPWFFVAYQKEPLILNSDIGKEKIR